MQMCDYGQTLRNEQISVTIVTFIIGSSVDISVKAIGGMTIVTLFGHQF